MGKLKDVYMKVASGVKQKVQNIRDNVKESAPKQTASNATQTASTRTSSSSTGKATAGTKTAAQSSQTSSANGNGQRRSNNEYRKQQEKKTQGKDSTGEKKKSQKRNNYLADTVEEDIRKPQKIYSADQKEAGKPEQKQNQQKIYSGNQEDADMDAAWANLEGKNAARAEGAPERKSELLTQYADAVEAERKAIATSPKLSRKVKDATTTRDQLEKAIMEENKLLGLDLYDGLENWSRRQDIIQSRTKENTAQYGSFLATPLEWIDTHLAYGDKPEGEVGKIGEFGQGLFESAQELNREAKTDFELGTSGMSNLAKTGLGLGKSFLNTGEDMFANILMPGMGLKLATARAAGAGALEQAERENNGIDARMGKWAVDGALTYLTERAIGGAESAFGKSWLSKELQEAIPQLNNPVLKRLFNTEWLEEGVQYGLTYLADKYFGLDPNAVFSWDEAKQQMAVGYLMGTVFNGIAGGIDYDAEKLRNVADEAARAAEMGLTPEEAGRIALTEPDENVKIEAGKQKSGAHEPESVARMKAAGETENMNDQGTRDLSQIAPAAETAANPAQESQPVGIENPVEPSPEEIRLLNRALNTQNPILWIETHGTTRQIQTLKAYLDQHPDIDVSIKSGPGSNDFPNTRQFLSDTAGMNADTDTESDQRVTDIINEFREEQGAVTQTPTEPNADTTRRVQDILKKANAEQRGLAPGEINQILNDPAALKAYADQTGTTVRQARAELEQLLNGGVGVEAETETAPEQPRVNDTERTPTNRFWNAVNEGPDALLHLIAEDPNNMEEYMRIFEESTGETMSNDPEVLQDQINRITDEAAERSGKKQLQAELESAEAELNDALREYNETGEWTPELDDLANRADSLRDQLGMEPNQYFSETGENAGNNNAETKQNTQPRQNTRQNRGNQNPQQNAGNQQQNNGQNQNGPGYQDSATTGNGKEKVSEHFTNTLTGREGEDVRSPITYLTKSDAETLQNAMNRLELNREAETQTLMATTMWTDEQVKMGKTIGNELLADARQSGDYTAYDAWRMVENEHARAIARALRAEAEAGADKTERTRSLSNRYLDLLESAQQDPNNKGPKVDQAVIDKARQTVNDVATEISRLESAEADYVRQGYSEEEAFDMVKDDYLDLAQRLVAERDMGLIWDNILLRNARIRRGHEDVQTRLRKMLAKEDPEYIRQYCRANNSGVATDVVYKSRPTVKQAATMISSLQSMCMLFGSGTFLRNTESNVVFGTLNNVSNNTFGVAADALISAATGQRTRGMGVGALSKSSWEAFARAGRRSVLEIAANMDMQEDGKYIGSTQAFSPYNPVTRIVARLNQILSYSLNTSDAVIHGMTSETAGNAALRVGEKSGMTEKTAEAIGKQEADFATFKNDTAVTKFLEGVQNFFDLVGFGGELVTFNGTNVVRGRKGGMGLGTLLAKFVKVPANIKSKGVEFGPGGVAIGTVNAVRAAKMAKNSAPNSQARQESMILQNKASGQIGRGMTGTAFVFGLAMLIKAAKVNGREWFKDWDQENNKNIKAQNKSEGKSGQQINLSALGLAEGEGGWETGDRAVDISSNEPMNQLLTMAAALADDEDMLSFDDYADAMYTGVTENIADMPCVETFSTFQQNMEYSKVYETTYEEGEEGNIVENREENRGATVLNALGAAAGSAVSGFVPGTARRIASIQDEYKRDTRGKNAAETAWNQVTNSIPTFEINGKTYGRGSLPVKTDAFGNPVSQGDKGTRVANAFLANRYSQVNQSEASKEVNRIYDETGKSFMPSSTAPRTVTFGSGKDKRTVELDTDEGRAYQSGRGQKFEKEVNALLKNPIYQKVSTGIQEAIMDKADEFTKANAKDKLATTHHVPYKNKYEGVSNLSDPTGYLVTNTTFGIANKNKDYDVIDMLIPQIGKMSGRDQAYFRDKNSAAMMYYDYMTPNAYGYKAESSEAVGYLKEQEKANAKARGVTQASGQDTMKAITKGYKDGKLTDDDVKAMMTKQASNGNFDVTKGSAAVFLAAIASGKSVETALNLANSADLDKDGTIDEKGLYIKPEREGTKVLKNAGINKAGQKAFDEIMYPNGRGKKNSW